MNDGRCLRTQDHQTVVDGFVDGAVSGDGETRDFAEGTVIVFCSCGFLKCS